MAWEPLKGNEAQIGLGFWKVLELGQWGVGRWSGSACGRVLDCGGLGMGLGAVGKLTSGLSRVRDSPRVGSRQEEN